MISHIKLLFYNFFIHLFFTKKVPEFARIAQTLKHIFRKHPNCPNSGNPNSARNPNPPPSAKVSTVSKTNPKAGPDGPEDKREVPDGPEGKPEDKSSMPKARSDGPEDKNERKQTRRSRRKANPNESRDHTVPKTNAKFPTQPFQMKENPKTNLKVPTVLKAC